MPSATEILAGLTRIANEAVVVAMFWHLLVAASIVALWAGVRPSQRLASVLLSLPLASVAVLALVFDNPFNGAVLAFGAVGLALLAAVTPPSPPVALASTWSAWLGVGLVAFGWAYPHFLEGYPSIAYAYAAPLGVLPCPTLSLAVGAALAGGGLAGGWWRVALAVLASFYGLFGVIRLGVWIDGALLLGAAALVAQHRRASRELSTADRAGQWLARRQHRQI